MRRMQRDIVINAQSDLLQIPIIVLKFFSNWNFLDEFSGSP